MLICKPLEQHTAPVGTTAEAAKPVPAEAIDRAMHQDKLNDGYAQRQQAQALRLQQSMPAASGFF